MSLNDLQPSENRNDLRLALEEMDLAEIVAGAPAPVIGRGRMLHQTGKVESISWVEGGSFLAVEVQGTTDRYIVRLGPDERTLGLSVECDCPYAQSQEQLCKHGVAVLLAVQTVQTGRWPRNVFVGSEYWQRLAAEFDAEPDDEGEGGGPVVVVDLDTRQPWERYSYQPLPGLRMSQWQVPPRELDGFTSFRPATADERDQAFHRWFCRPSRIGVMIKIDGEFHELERRPPVPLASACELDLVEGEAILRRRVWDAASGDPVELAMQIGERLFYLENGHLGWVEEEELPDLWPAALRHIADWHRSHGFALFDVDVEESGLSLPVEVSLWNEMNVPWPLGGTSKQPPPLRVQGEKSFAVAKDPSVNLDVAPNGSGSFAIRIEMTADGADLWYAQEVLCTAFDATQFIGSNFTRLSARTQALEQAVYRLLSVRLDKERRQVIKEIKAHSAVARIQDGPRTAAAVLRRVGRSHALSAAATTLHAGGEEGAENWFTVEGGLRTAAQAALLVTSVLPEAEAAIGDEEFYFSIEEKALTRGLAALGAACRRAGVGLTMEQQAVETMRLDFAVSATRDAEKLDWFALAPQVMADGSLIPQEKWEEWMLGGMIRGEDGKLRVLSPESAATLEKFAQILDFHQGEVPFGGRAKGDGLRVPRLRIFDWLALRQAGVRCDLPPEEGEVLEALAAFDKLPKERLPKAVQAKLRPYQKEGYDWLSFLYKNRFGACLADDMGLGKTLQAIALLAARTTARKRKGEGGGEKLPHLVVLPPTLLFNWRHEIETFCPRLRVDELTGPQRDLDAIDADVILTTYELARRDIDMLERREFDVIIFDEAQAIKNLAGERSKAMRRLKGKFKLCLTGTPLENHAGEYYSILELALPGLFGDYRAFMKSLSGEGSFRPIDRARPFVLRRTKEKILKELPEKTESDVWLDLTETQKIFYSRAVAEVREEVFRAFRDKTAQQAGIVALSALMRLRQICISPALIDAERGQSSPKIEYLLEKLTELEEEGHAALVFSQFTRALDLVEKELKRKGVDFLRMDGTTSQSRRKAQVAAFQKGTGPAFFLISLKTGGVGLNLTRASYVFHLDPWWNPAVENQASDRVHRIGQTQRVFVNRLLMRHTVEEKMMVLKKRKRTLFDQVVGGSENRSGSSLLTRDDMAWLLEAPAPAAK